MCESSTGGWTESELRGLLVGLIEEEADAKAPTHEENEWGIEVADDAGDGGEGVEGASGGGGESGEGGRAEASEGIEFSMPAARKIDDATLEAYKVADTGAVEALVELAARSAPDREPAVVTDRVLERVAWALRNLAKDKITRKRVAKAGGAAQLVALAARSAHRGVLEEVRGLIAPMLLVSPSSSV